MDVMLKKINFLYLQLDNRNIAGLDKSNTYNKLGKNVLGFIPDDDIANTIR